MSMLYIASCENCGHEHDLAKSYARTSACTIYLTVDCNAVKCTYQAAIGDLEFFCELGHHFDLSSGSVFHLQY
jgi:hypothetical protein